MKLNMKLWSQSNIDRYNTILHKIKSFDFSSFDCNHPRNTGRHLYQKFCEELYPELFSFPSFLYITRNINSINLDSLFCSVCGNRVEFYPRKGTYRLYCSRKCLHRAESIWHNHIEEVSNTIVKQSFNISELKDTIDNIIKNFDFSNIQTQKRSCVLSQSTRFEYEKFCEIYGLIFNIHEFVYLSRNFTNKEKVLNQMFCSVCGNKKNLTSSVRIPEYCCSECYYISEESKVKRQNTCMDVYGVPNVSQVEEFKEKIKATNNGRYGVPCVFQSEEIKEKSKKTTLERYHVENPSQSEEIKLKKEQTSEIHFGVKCPLQSPEVKEKGKETTREKYGAEYYSQSEEAKRIKRQTNLERFNVPTNLLLPEVVEKRNKTLHERYGTSPFSSKEVCEKALQSKRENGTFNTSSPEDKFYLDLKRYFPNIIRQYKNNRYPFLCDFYIPINDLYIELNLTWTHGGRPFNCKSKKDSKKLKLWRKKAKISKYYKSAIKVWTIRDPLKFKMAKENKLNYLTFYNIEDAYKWLSSLYEKSYYKELILDFSLEELLDEYKKIQSSIPNYGKVTNVNNIVLNFQQLYFFKEEMKKWKDSRIKHKVIQNRIHYIGKGLGELTRKEILQGLKTLGIVKGYSHFNPQWIRKFIEDYRVTSIYDPCGGWGHRLVGLSKDFLYIYNDISMPIYNGVKEIASFLGMNNKYFYNNDCSKGVPIKFINRIDAIFTCPPYHDKVL